MPKKTLWLIAAALALVLYIAWRAGSYPARVALLNHSGRTLREVAVTGDGRRVVIGELRNGDSRAVSVPSGGQLIVTFRGSEERRWEAPAGTLEVKVIVLSIDGNERVSIVDRSAYR